MTNFKPAADAFAAHVVGLEDDQIVSIRSGMQSVVLQESFPCQQRALLNEFITVIDKEIAYRVANNVQAPTFDEALPCETCGYSFAEFASCTEKTICLACHIIECRDPDCWVEPEGE